MARCRVVVLYGHSLMLKGLLRWLSEQKDVEAAGIDILAPEARARIGDLSPQVIILDEEDMSANVDLCLSELVRDYPEARVVKVEPASNTISVFRQQKVVIAQVNDLLRLVTAP